MTTGDDKNGPHMIQNPDCGFCEGNKSVMLVTWHSHFWCSQV